MTNRNWTEAQLKLDLEELHRLLDRATRESRGLPDDIVAQRLFKLLIRRRRVQIQALHRNSAGMECGPSGSASLEPKTTCNRI